ncbi:MAG: cutinase family protein [Gordonia sp.]|uniref:cutinase family protein n=1 Tax=Williamsia sp. 1138 TaxID=1903117 RepID=UPI000A10A46C|nr:cutinase family protein [Williamsia sp. 1138]MBA4021436.1 cutinase family protein [Gordonia sp. (in: high G+C Gram-positive bacteria)]OZG30662.1 cutinase [Williamsia sp. 1138]
MRVRRWVSALAAGILTAGTVSVLSAPTAVADPADCPELYVLAIPGTWENSADGQVPGMLSYPTSGLGSETRVQLVGYNATAFPWETGGSIYGKSKAQAVANAEGLAITMTKRCPATKIAVIGYSQGADAAGDFAAEVGTRRGVIKPSQFAGAVLISDPRRTKRDALIGPKLSGEGNGGPRQGGFGWVSDRTFTICEPGDQYCNIPRDYYVSRIAGYLAETSDPNPDQLGQYQAEAWAIVSELVTRGGPGALVDELSNEKARAQIVAFNRFLQSGSHGDYANFQVEPGVTALQWAQNYLAGLA